MDRYEYKISSMSNEAEMTRLGREGWRIINATGGSVILERKVPDDEPE